MCVCVCVCVRGGWYLEHVAAALEEGQEGPFRGQEVRLPHIERRREGTLKVSYYYYYYYYYYFIIMLIK